MLWRKVQNILFEDMINNTENPKGSVKNIELTS